MLSALADRCTSTGPSIPSVLGPPLPAPLPLLPPRARRWATAWVVAALMAGASPPAAAGQWSDIQSLEVGDSLRVRLPGALRVEASMRGLQSDTLLLRVRGLSSDWPVSAYDLVSLERFRDRTASEGLRDGVTIGAVVGLFVGAGFGVLLQVASGGESDDRGLEMIRSTLRYAGVGAGAGGIVGGVRGSRNPGRGWVALPVPSR